MINQRYRLTAPKQFRIDLLDEQLAENEIYVRPKYLAVCEADKRYYSGNRPQEILKKKLPMCLIHEAVGEVVCDPSGSFDVGTKVVMIPNTPFNDNPFYKENYDTTSKFRSSGYDGFMQGIVKIRKDRVIPYKNSEPEVAVLTEIMSCIMNGIEHFEKVAHEKKDTIGIWGPGNMGFVTALLLKKMYPNSKIILFGIDHESMEFFSFVDEKYLVNDIPADLRVDHAFECVGGPAGGIVINQIIDHIQPQGCINLIGVSADPVAVNTRMILEKGLNLLGNSRSGYVDFKRVVDILEENEDVRNYLHTIITDIIEVKDVKDMNYAFDYSMSHPFKTIMKWKI